MFKPLRSLAFSLLTLWSFGLFAQEDVSPAPPAPPVIPTGTLVLDVKPFTSEKDLPKRVVKQLKSGMLEWGIHDRQLVFTLVTKRFLDFPINQTTRFGTNQQMSLPAGEYKITGVGLEMTSSLSVDKVLERGAYFNEDIVTFKIEPGKTTTLSINPMIKIDRTFAVNFWVPSLMTSVIYEGATATPEVALNDRNDKSIPWPQYNGPLKFVAK
jgi:hypothetical protein